MEKFEDQESVFPRRAHMSFFINPSSQYDQMLKGAGTYPKILKTATRH